jgi:molecular chaperone Hsp33
MAKVHRFVTNDFTVRIAAVDTTEVVAEMQSIQNSFPLATVGIGRAMTGALLLASHLKEGQQVGLHFRGNGPLSSIFAEADFDGKVRGYCPNPDYQAPVPEDVLNLKKALGFGLLNVTRQQPFQRQPFNGTVEMESGEIGEDIAHYLHQSHQIRSLINLGVYLDVYGKAKAAGGILIEVMPGVEDEVVNRLQTNADKVKANISKMILDGALPTDLVAPYLEGIPYTQIPHEPEVQYHCPCTVDRVMRALGALGQNDLREMIEKGESTEVQCQMCGKSYEVSIADLETLQEALRKNSMH